MKELLVALLFYISPQSPLFMEHEEKQLLCNTQATVKMTTIAVADQPVANRFNSLT